VTTKSYILVYKCDCGNAETWHLLATLKTQFDVMRRLLATSKTRFDVTSALGKWEFPFAPFAVLILPYAIV